MNVEDIVREIMNKEFSPEITDDEVIEFISAHPYKEWAVVIELGYQLLRTCNTPYEALRKTLISYIKTVEGE